MSSTLFIFRYPITRIYPHAWFPWAVYIGGACVLILSSLLNFAANGYILDVHYTNDYNGTITTKTWAQKLAFTSRVVASCQPQNLQVNTQLYTDKLALVYGLDKIWVEGEDGTGRIKTLPSLQYAHNPMRDCSISMIQVDMSSDDGMNARQRGATPWGISALGIVTCFIDNERTTKVNLTVRYEFVSPTYRPGMASRFVQPPDEKTQSVLWWGESLLSWYWLNLMTSAENQRYRPSTDITYEALKGSVYFEPSNNTTDTTSLAFFNPNYHFTFATYNHSGPSHDDHLNGASQCCINDLGIKKPIGVLHHERAWPDIWIEADWFAKVFYSVILADLGQATGPTNMLSNASSLALFSQNITRMSAGGVMERDWLKAGPARTPFQEKDKGNGNFNITPSFFFTEYLCQVPTPKSVASLILSVLVANLVFLSAAWTLLNWFAVAHLEKSDATAHQCAGCMGSVCDVQTGTKDRVGVSTAGYEPVRG